MRTGTLLGFGLTILCSIAACSSLDERVLVGISPGAGGNAGAGGDVAGVGSGGQGGAGSGGGPAAPVPYIEPTWIKVVPNIYVIDAAADTTNHLVAVAITVDVDANTNLDGIPLSPKQMFVVKIDPNGNVVWLRSLDIPRYARAIAIGPENRVVVLSETGSRTIQIVIPPPQKYDRFYLTTFTADGELLWEQSFGGDSSRQIQCDTNNGDVAIDNQGNAIVAGSFNGTLETPLGAFQTSTAGNDIVFVKVEPNGTIVAAKHFDAPESQYLHDVAIDGTNHALAVVGENGSQSVMKLDESFSVVWTKGVSADAPVYSPKYVAIGADDKILLAGVFDGTDPAQPMKQWFPFLAQWDAAGNQVSNKAFSESQVDGLSFAAKLSGEFVFGVDFSSPINLGGGTISNYETSNDSVLARYSADGTYTAGAYVGGLGSQYTTAIALTPQGPTYWATHYWDSLTYGDQMLVEPLPPDSQAMTRLQGTALFALPP